MKSKRKNVTVLPKAQILQLKYRSKPTEGAVLLTGDTHAMNPPAPGERGFAVGLVPYAGRPPAWEGALGLRAAGELEGGSLSKGATPPPASPSRASSALSGPLVPAPAGIMEPALPSLQFQVKRQAPWKPYSPPRVSLMMSLT